MTLSREASQSWSRPLTSLNAQCIQYKKGKEQSRNENKKKYKLSNRKGGSGKIQNSKISNDLLLTSILKPLYWFSTRPTATNLQKRWLSGYQYHMGHLILIPSP